MATWSSFLRKHGVDDSSIGISKKKLQIKDGGVGATKLASNAVTTEKITDANVTLAKLAMGASRANNLAGEIDSTPTKAELEAIAGDADANEGAVVVVTGDAGTGDGDQFLCVSDGVTWLYAALTASA